MERIETLPLAALRESPFNPRRTYSQAGLEELANSISTHGVMSPIVVRPLAQGDIELQYEVVFGHRRARAALLAGLDSIPALIRDLDDEQAAVAQIHENLQREDVHPIEEAEAFAALMQTHGVSADQLVRDTGKSRSYIYGRLKLATLTPAVRLACMEQGLGTEIALLIARLPKSLQDKGLQHIKQYGDEWQSYRIAKQNLAHRFTIDLAEAPFDRNDTKLLASAGSCLTCPKRAGNAPDLADLPADVCTDVPCYEQKELEHVEQRILKHRKSKQPVIEGEAAKALMPNQWSQPIGYTRLSTQLDDGTTVREARVAVDGKSPKVTLIVNPHEPTELIECITDDEYEQLAEAWEANGDRAEGAPTPSSAARAQEEGLPNWLKEQREREAARLAARTPEERAVDGYEGWDALRPRAIAAAAARHERTGFELLLVARTLVEDRYDIDEGLIDAMGWSAEVAEWRDSTSEFEDEEAWVAHRLTSCTPDELARFCVLAALTFGSIQRGEAATAEKLAIAEHYGIDVLAVAAEQDQTDDASFAGEEA